jgi:flagellar biosynthesis/type III secretory pathway protein FliH
MKARVIKAGDERVVPAPLVDARARAAALVAEAEARAAALVSGAEAVREAARREGERAGREAGLAQASATIAAAAAAAARREAAAESDLRRLAVRIAEKLLGRELALSPGAVVDVVRAALAEAAGRRELLVRVHPEDLEAVAAARARLAAALAPATLAVRADPGVSRGGCLVDTEVGTIDARLEVQLAAIEQALLGAAP